MPRKRSLKTPGDLPLVSVCTPTCNRRIFIPSLIRCFEAQTYPRDRMEWIVVDDGSDAVEDLFTPVEGVNYIRIDEKMRLGQKRNFMHAQARGEIIVYMDDDDYYPPDRVQHAVNRLRAKPGIKIAGSSIMHVYFKDLDRIYQLGPYGPNHATAGTFAFKRTLLDETRYDDDAYSAEEKHFLKGFTIPMVQLEAKKTILVCAHDYNSYDKRQLLNNPNSEYVKPTRFKLQVFIKDAELRDFYSHI